MSRFIVGSLIVAAAVAIPAARAVVRRGPSQTVALPDPALPMPNATSPARQTAVLAGGCFWGIEAVFEHMKGVIDVVSGYSGGAADSAEYGTVSSGRTGHAESVRITFDPAQIAYGQLLKVFFSVAHDPTQLDRQGPDVGPQYRSVIFYGDGEQASAARAYIAQLEQAKVFPRPIVTQLVPLKAFYMAEAYHQDYAAHFPDDPYIAYHDRPKVERLRKEFPELYRTRK